MTTGRDMKRSRWAAIALAVIIFSMPSVALAAYASSGWVYRSTVDAAPHGNVRVCLEAAVYAEDGYAVMNYGTIATFNTIGAYCDGGVGVGGVGWLGVTLDGYRNGAFCGTTYYQYSSGPTYIKSAADDLCFNLWGSQNYHTNVFGRVYNANCGCYHNIPGISSPAQNG